MNWATIALLVAAWMPSNKRDVPPVTYTTPPSHACNVNTCGEFSCLAVCITENETHTACADKRRFLLTDQGGTEHCILFG